MITILGNIFQLCYVLDEADNLPTTYIFRLSGVFIVQAVVLGLNIYFWICIQWLYNELKLSRGGRVDLDEMEYDEDDLGLPAYSRIR